MNDHTDDDIIRFPVELVRGRASFTDSLIKNVRTRLPQGFEVFPDLEAWLRAELDELYDEHLSKKPFTFQKKAFQVSLPNLQVSQQQAKAIRVVLEKEFQALAVEVASAAAKHYNKIIDGLAAELLSFKVEEYLKA